MKAPSHRIVPLIVGCALFMEQIDGSIIATAVPRISEALKCDPVYLNLAITAYMFSLAVFIPISGWIADRFGARNVFRTAILIFLAGSVACACAQNIEQLVLARILQGSGGAMMVPVGRLVLLRTIPKSEFVDAMAWMVTPALAGPIIGPPLGGFIVTVASWRWIFLINIPIGLLGYIYATRYIGNLRGRKRENLDLYGFVFLAISMASLMFVLEATGRNAVPDSLLFGVAVTTLLSFLIYYAHSRKLESPIVDLRPMIHQTFRASVVGGSFFRIAIGALPFLLPLMLQYGYGMSPGKCGLIVLSNAIGAMAMKATAKPIIKKLGFRTTLIGNGALNVLFFGGLAFLTSGSFTSAELFLYFLMGGLVYSLQFTAINTIAFADTPDYMANRANTLYSMIQQLMLSIGIAIGALALNLTLHFENRNALQINDFSFAFYGLAALCAVSMISFVTLPQQAGANVSGHKAATEKAEEPN